MVYAAIAKVLFNRLPWCLAMAGWMMNNWLMPSRHCGISGLSDQEAIPA
jgi:hypothetical protein